MSQPVVTLQWVIGWKVTLIVETSKVAIHANPQNTCPFLFVSLLIQFDIILLIIFGLAFAASDAKAYLEAVDTPPHSPYWPKTWIIRLGWMQIITQNLNPFLAPNISWILNHFRRRTKGRISCWSLNPIRYIFMEEMIFSSFFFWTWIYADETSYSFIHLSHVKQ